ncbi:MAG: 16S rRNA (guanine(527)-N(7))-methyltransferase RsmG [Desulfomonilaceae bacterium]
MTLLSQPSDPAEIIRQGSRLLEIPITDEAISKMRRHMELLMEWSSRVNLTALSDPRDVAIFHFLDSLTVFKVVPQCLPLRVLDVGSGAGFPGIVMRTAEESIDLSVLDRNPKKIVFLKHVARELKLTGVRFLNSPLQHIMDNASLGHFDVVVSRAFASDPHLMDTLHHLLAPSGSLVRMAGPASARKAFPLHNFREVFRWDGTLPFSESHRSVFRYTKIV